VTCEATSDSKESTACESSNERCIQSITQQQLFDVQLLVSGCLAPALDSTDAQIHDMRSVMSIVATACTESGMHMRLFGWVSLRQDEALRLFLERGRWVAKDAKPSTSEAL
jgi:hypothetical protein